MDFSVGFGAPKKVESPQKKRFSSRVRTRVYIYRGFISPSFPIFVIRPLKWGALHVFFHLYIAIGE